MRIIVTTTPGSSFMPYLTARLPSLEVVVDTARCAYLTFVASLMRQGDDPAIHIEDDIVLTMDFEAKVASVVHAFPGSIVQFFSLRKASSEQLAAGGYWDRSFAMNQCTYIPAGYAPLLIHYAERWPPFVTDREHNKGAYDLMMNAWLKARREPYWMSLPSLVQHRVARSRIDPRRSSRRQSPTFVDPDGDL